jgi:hypothetical protein
MAWQLGGEFALTATKQDPFSFHLMQAVGHLASTTFASIHTFPITDQLPMPALKVVKAMPMGLASSLARAPATITSSRIGTAFRRSFGVVSVPSALTRRRGHLSTINGDTASAEAFPFGADPDIAH